MISRETPSLVRMLVGLWTLALACAACGDADENGRPRFSASPPSDQQVSTLDTGARTELCETFDAYVNTYVNLDAVAYLACLPGAIWTTTDREACNVNLNNCLRLFPRPIQVSARAQDLNVCFDTLNQCQATVADLEACVNVNVDLALEVYERWSCDLVNDQDVRAMAQPMASGNLVSVCADVNAACNDFASVGPD